ncbi:MAG: DUF502 domain-containing protein [Candidatus Binatia bacterium]
MPSVSTAKSPARTIDGAHPTPFRRVPDHRPYPVLPIGGTILLIIIAERSLSPLVPDRFYFPGEGLLLVIALLYLLGLMLTSVVGRWIWDSLDCALSRLPGLGMLYRTLKQILGFDAGEGALFQQVVLVPDQSSSSMEIGLVTATEGDGGSKQLIVFVPCSPNPSQGRLLRIPASRVTPTDWTVDKALKALFSLGKI